MVDRFSQQFQDYGVIPSANGDFVRFGDYRKLKAELDDARENVKELNLSVWEQKRCQDGLEASLAAAQATIEQMREYFGLIEQRFCGWHTVAEEALALPANLDALHEARALECERLAKFYEAGYGTNQSIPRWLREEAAAHRARKQATKEEGK